MRIWSLSEIHRKLATAKNNIIYQALDRFYGIDTMPESVHVDGPADWKTLRYVFRRIRISPGAVFVDIGCGKGRPLLVAAEAGFSKVFGIEINPKLAAIAEKNAQIFLSKKALSGSIQVIAGDAEKLDLPEADYFFLFNPFGEASLKKFLRAAIASAKSANKEKFLIYRAAVCHEAVLSFPEIQPYDLGLGESYKSYRFYKIDGLR
jgi:SAM-dependent methyltransferase